MIPRCRDRDLQRKEILQQTGQGRGKKCIGEKEKRERNTTWEMEIRGRPMLSTFENPPHNAFGTVSESCFLHEKLWIRRKKFWIRGIAFTTGSRLMWDAWTYSHFPILLYFPNSHTLAFLLYSYNCAAASGNRKEKCLSSFFAITMDCCSVLGTGCQ